LLRRDQRDVALPKQRVMKPVEAGDSSALVIDAATTAASLAATGAFAMAPRFGRCRARCFMRASLPATTMTKIGWRPANITPRGTLTPDDHLFKDRTFASSVNGKSLLGALQRQR
jgi:hypothetical protein